MTYTLPHPLDRPGQLEAFNWLSKNDKKYLIICAPTGSGKSAWPAEMSKDQKVMVLTQTKSLQAENYSGIYGFDPLYGKASYPCEDSENEVARIMKWTAYDCQVPDCECPYQSQERQCLNSVRVSLNYAKYLMSRPFVQIARPQMLFLDEAHNLPDIVCDFIGLSLRWDNEFIRHKDKPPEPMQLNYFEAMAYFRQCYSLIMQNKPDKEEDLPRWRRWKRLKQKIEVVNDVIGQSELNDWYYEADEEKLTIKPLSAKYHFKTLFNAPKIVLMSATIKPSIIEKLGIKEDETDFYEMDNIWPIPSRLIYDLNAPKINYRSSEEDKQKQAELIGSVLRNDKSGIIHVSSKFQAASLKRKLDRQFSAWIPKDGIGTQKQLEQWYQIRKAGLYCISWCFHEGVNLPDEDICIMAKTPYPGLGSNYEMAKKDYDPQWYLEKTAYVTEQLFGRIWRGELEHYVPGRKLAYIADSSWHRLKSHLSLDFKKRIRKHNGK